MIPFVWGGFNGILATLSYQSHHGNILSACKILDIPLRSCNSSSCMPVVEWAKFFLYYQAQNVDNTASPGRIQFEMSQSDHFDHIHIVSVGWWVHQIDRLGMVNVGTSFSMTTRTIKENAEPSSYAPFLHELHPASSRIAQENNLKIAQKPYLIVVKAIAVQCFVLFL